MAIETAVNIDVNVDGTSTVQQAANAYEDLGDAVSKTQLEAERLAHQFGINDARTQEAIKRAGQYKNEMEQLDFAIEGAKGGSQQLLKGTQAIVGGFEAAIGAAALFGGESEELEAALLKVQGAMALSQGLADFQEFSPALKNLGKTITGPLTTAFKNFGKTVKGTLASTGIGLLVVAVGTLVAYWDDIKAAVSGVSEEQKKLLKDQELSVAAAKQQLDDISAQENILRQQGKTEQEILNLKIAATKNAITQLEAQIKQQKIVRDQQIETAKRNKDILSGILKFVEAPLYILLKGIDVALNAFGKESDLANQFADFGASLLFDPEEVEKEADAAIEAQEKELQTMKNNLAGYEMSITKIRKDNYKKQQEDLKKAKEEEQKIEDEAFNQWLEQEIANDEYRKKLAEEQRQREEEEFNQWLEQEIARDDYRKQLAQEEIEREQAVQDAKNAIFDESVKLGDAIIALAGESSKVGKAIALAQIGADTARALSGALANANSPTPDNVATGGLAGIAKYIALATTILSNAKRAYNIIKAPAPSAGSTPSRPSAPGVPQMSAPRLGGVLNPENEITQQRKVYVVESDITSTQAKVSNTQKVSLVE